MSQLIELAVHIRLKRKESDSLSLSLLLSQELEIGAMKVFFSSMIGYIRSCQTECGNKHFKVAMMISAQADGWSEEDCSEKRKIRKTCKEATTSERK